MTLDSSFPIGPCFDPSRSTLEEYIDGLYRIFRADLVSRPLRWKDDGMIVSMRRLPEIEGRHAVFWQIISGGSGSEASREVELQ